MYSWGMNTLWAFFPSFHVFLRIMYFWESCISENHVFLRVMYFWESCISENHVFLRIMYFWESSISENHVFLRIMYFWESCISEIPFLFYVISYQNCWPFSFCWLVGYFNNFTNNYFMRICEMRIFEHKINKKLRNV